MKDKGFTYLEIIVSFMIFGLMLIIALRLSSSIYTIMQHNLQVNQMQHIAQLEIENYQSGILDIGQFVSDTGFTLVTEIVDADDVVTNRTLQNSDVNGKYTVIIVETSINESISEVKVEIQMNTVDIEPVVVFGRILKK